MGVNVASKKIGNPIELRVIYHITPNGDLIECAKACYNVIATEYGISEARMLLLQHNQEIQNCLKDFAEEAIAQVDIQEQIPEEDSLIEYPRPE